MIDLDAVYTILTAVARRRTQLSYEDLSDRYCVLTKQWHDPLATWREPLAELSQILHRAGWPALSAVVVLKTTSEPGRGFWGSSPNVPQQPSSSFLRTVQYGQLLEQIYRAPWPRRIPSARGQQGQSTAAPQQAAAPQQPAGGSPAGAGQKNPPVQRPLSPAIARSQRP